MVVSVASALPGVSPRPYFCNTFRCPFLNFFFFSFTNRSAAGAYLAQRREIAEADASNRLVFGRALRFVGEHRVRAANAKAGSMPDAVATLQEALDVLSEPGVPAADASRDRVFILSVLYDVHYEAGRWNDALTVAEARRDLIIQLRSANDAAMPRAMLAIAQCMCRLGRTAEGSSMVMEAAEKVAAIEGQSQATGRFLKTAGVAMRKLKVYLFFLVCVCVCVCVLLLLDLSLGINFDASAEAYTDGALPSNP